MPHGADADSRGTRRRRARRAVPARRTPRARRRPNFLRAIIAEDNRTGKYGGRVVTRFPPEPNGYLHYGHAKSICLNFGLAAENDGVCHLRFDDTNPVKEDVEYEDSIADSVRWLGFDWGEHRYHASDYYDRLYEFAEWFIGQGLAYVDSQTAAEVRATRGTLTQPGARVAAIASAAIAENLDLFRRMRAGEFPDGAHVLRLKIDMASPNLNMRDPGDLPHPPRVAPPHRRQVVHLSALRLHALHLGCARSGSRTRSARSNSRTTGRSTTG